MIKSLIGNLSGGKGGIIPNFTSSATQSGDSSSGHNTIGGGFPFGAPASQNMLIYIGLGVALAVLWKRKK